MMNLLLSVTDISNGLVNFLSDTFGIWYLIILNAFGVIAIVFKMSEAWLKRRCLIIAFACISTGCWMCYYLLNGNFTSMLVSVVAITKYLIFAQRERHKWADSKWWLYGFIVLQVIICVLTFKNWTSILSVSAGILGTFAYFTLSQKSYRWCLLSCQSCWVIHDAINLYYVALFANVLASVSIIFSIIKFSIAERKSNRELKQNL